MTAQPFGTGSFGCSLYPTSNTVNKCSNAATLTDDDFTAAGAAYRITILKVETNGDLTLTLDRAIADSLKAYTLQVGNARFFHLADAVISGDAVQSDTATWSNTGLSWTAGTAVRLRLVAPAVNFSHARYTGYEGVALQIDLTSQHHHGALTVNVVATDGTTSASADLDRASWQVTFPAGVNQVSFYPVLLEDRTTEGTESLMLSILPGDGYSVGTTRPTATLDIVDTSVSEAGHRPFYIATLTAQSLLGGSFFGCDNTAASAVAFCTAALDRDGLTVDGVHYRVRSLSSFSSSGTAGALSLSFDKDIPASFRKYTLTLDGAQFRFADAQFRGTVADWLSAGPFWSQALSVAVTIGPPPPSAKTVWFNQNAYTVDESDGHLTVTLRTVPHTEDFTAIVRTHDGSAKSGSDFTRSDWRVHFHAGAIESSFIILIASDGVGEGKEIFTLYIAVDDPSNPTYWLGRPSQASVNIVDTGPNVHPYQLKLTGGQAGSRRDQAQIAASWRRDPAATGYYLQYWEAGQNMNDNWESRHTVQAGSSATTATLPETGFGPRMIQGRQYWVRMGAIKANGRTEWAQAIKATAGLPLPWPSSVTPGVTADGFTTLTVSWRRDPLFSYGADVIQIMPYSEVGNLGDGTVTGWPNLAATHSLPPGVIQLGRMTDVGGLKSLTFKGFKPGTTYLVRMHSVVGDVFGALAAPSGNPVLGMRATTWAAPGAPQGLRATGGDGQLRATWR